MYGDLELVFLLFIQKALTFKALRDKILQVKKAIKRYTF